MIPSRILFIASDAVVSASQIRLLEGGSCPEFDRWLRLNRPGVGIDFRRILRVGFDVRCFGDYIVNGTVFEEISMICDSGEVPNEIYDGFEESEIEKLINFRHPCIAVPIDFVFPIQSGSRQAWNLDWDGCSKLKVVSVKSP
jgi:hypothetical protein